MFVEKTIHPFENIHDSDRIMKPGFIAGMLAITGLVGLFFAKAGVIGEGAIVGLIGVFIYGIFIFKNPILGLYTSVVLCFMLLGLGRYLPNVQVGLGLDAIIYLTYIALFFNRFHEKINWAPARKDITLLSTIWFAYSVFELVNPEAKNFEAWFTGRAAAMYMFMLVPLALLFITNNKRLETILIIWATFSILATLKGIVQMKLGVDRWEKAWLDAGNYKTHILFGKLRVFSFFSDAGQFGANQAYTGVVMLIVSASAKGKKKWFFLIAGILGLYGMIISGTRGAISVPLSGFSAYFVYRKNVALLLTGFGLLLVIFVFFKFTTIGQGNADIRRMRTAFDPNDASLQVRLANQKRLKVYLASRPFGGGIGLGGVKAQRFRPNAFLSNVATDSWYVLIWVEEGIIGLSLHLFILFYILIKASYKIMFKIRSPEIKIKMAALASGMVGVMVASYGNAVLGQMPTNVLIYLSMAILLTSEIFDEEKLAQTNESISNNNILKNILTTNKQKI